MFRYFIHVDKIYKEFRENKRHNRETINIRTVAILPYCDRTIGSWGCILK